MSRLPWYFFPVAETARPQVTAALASQFGPKKAPGWIKHDQTLGVQMDLSIDPPFVSSTDHLSIFKPFVKKSKMLIIWISHD